MKNIIISILFSLAGLGGLFAQHEFSARVGGGLSSLSYDLSSGAHTNGFGGRFGAGYNYFFNNRWGLGVGFELGLYNAKSALPTFGYSINPAFDIDGKTFEFITNISNFNERQQTMMFQIPLMLQFQTAGNGKRQFYAAAGAKAGIPIGEKYDIETTVVNAGKYELEVIVYDNDRFWGFDKFEDKYNGSLDFNTAFFASAEFGVKWKLKDRMSLYTGVYLDYGLNNIHSKASSIPPVVEYNTDIVPNRFAVSSVMRSHNGSSHSFTDKVTPVAAGVTLRLAFGGSKSEAVKDIEEPVIMPRIIVYAADPVADPEPELTEILQIAEEEKLHLLFEDIELVVADEETAQREAAQAEADKRMAAIELIEQPIKDYHLSQNDPDARQTRELDDIIGLLHQYPDLQFYIYGHTCDLGSNEVNERLGLQRAETAKAYMLSKGIAESRILGTISKRDSEPLVPNTDEENRRTNRRVQIVVEK